MFCAFFFGREIERVPAEDACNSSLSAGGEDNTILGMIYSTLLFYFLTLYRLPVEGLRTSGYIRELELSFHSRGSSSSSTTFCSSRRCDDSREVDDKLEDALRFARENDLVWLQSTLGRNEAGPDGFDTVLVDAVVSAANSDGQLSEDPVKSATSVLAPSLNINAAICEDDDVLMDESDGSSPRAPSVSSAGENLEETRALLELGYSPYDIGAIRDDVRRVLIERATLCPRRLPAEWLTSRSGGPTVPEEEGSWAPVSESARTDQVLIQSAESISALEERGVHSIKLGLRLHLQTNSISFTCFTDIDLIAS